MRKPVTIFILFLLTAATAVQDLRAADHLVAPAELHQVLIEAAQERRQNLSKVENFFSSSDSEAALRAAGSGLREIRQAVSMLSDEELARLATQTQTLTEDLAAGALSNQELTYIIIALVAAVIVLIAVAA
ncbi:MAG: hypothetical protein ACRD1R_16710 [Acidobacteriota bacterium]